MPWTQEEVEILIESFQEFPCLYNTKHQQYKNKHARLEALTAVTSAVKAIKPTTNQTEVKAKFQALKTTFLNEHKKRENSRRSGAGEDATYHPTIFYYDKMMFILEHVLPRTGTDSIQPEEGMEEDEQRTEIYDDDNNVLYTVNFRGDFNDGEILEVVHSPGSPEGLTSKSSIGFSDSGACTSGTNSKSSSRAPTPGRNSTIIKSKRKRSLDDNLLDVAVGAIQDINNKFFTKDEQQPIAAKTTEDIFGELVSSQLKQLRSKKLKSEVQYKISTLLYEAIDNESEQ